jgi:TonB family protein
MKSWLALVGALGLAAAGCGKPAPPPEEDAIGGGATATPPDQEPPVPLNADSPIQYPPRLYDQRVEGDVVLRLFVDSGGRLLPESSKVAESSGYSGLDSAALAGARRLRFAPARRRGLAVATAFLQPIEFRRPAGGGTAAKAKPDTSSPRRPTPRPPPVMFPPLPPRPRPDSAGALRDSTAAPRDTGGVRRDTSKAKADSGAGAH